MSDAVYVCLTVSVTLTGFFSGLGYESGFMPLLKYVFEVIMKFTRVASADSESKAKNIVITEMLEDCNVIVNEDEITLVNNNRKEN